MRLSHGRADNYGAVRELTLPSLRSVRNLAVFDAFEHRSGDRLSALQRVRVGDLALFARIAVADSVIPFQGLPSGQPARRYGWV